MNVIKKYWKLFIGAILALFGAGVIYTKINESPDNIFTNNEDKTKNIVDETVKKETEVIEKSEVVVKEVEEKQQVVRKRVNKKKKRVSNLEKAKNNPPKHDRTLAEAKENIIKKTERK